MKFAFLIMGDFNGKRDRAEIHDKTAQMIGVADIDEACKVARELCKEGVSCIELCGAFGAAGTRKIVSATRNQIPIGYVTHLPEQDAVYQSVFGEEK